MGASNKLSISVRVDERRWRELSIDVRDLCDRAVKASFVVAGQGPYGEVSVLLTNDSAMSEFNSRYRGREGPANVLSFPVHLGSAHSRVEVEPVLWGDIAISFDRVKHEAKCEAKPIRDHTAHLVVHGTLHLLGFDHKEVMDAASMKGLEVSSLARLGISDPYSTEANVELSAL